MPIARSLSNNDNLYLTLSGLSILSVTYYIVLKLNKLLSASILLLNNLTTSSNCNGLLFMKYSNW